MTGRELAAKLEVNSKSYVYNLENGHAPIGPKMRVRLGKIFNCDPSEFIDDAPPTEISTPGSSRFRQVPVVGNVGADTFEFSFDDPALEYLPVLVEGPASRQFASFRIVGDCMEPDYHAGEYVIVAQAETVPDGRAGVFRLDGGCTLKIPHRTNDHVELRPLNPKFKTLRIATNKLVVVGVVVGAFRKP